MHIMGMCQHTEVPCSRLSHLVGALRQSFFTRPWSALLRSAAEFIPVGPSLHASEALGFFIKLIYVIQAESLSGFKPD